MNRNSIVLIFAVYFLGCSINKSNLECGISISRESVSFGDCYNGLVISKLKVNDTLIGLYPHNFEKATVYELVEKKPIKSTEINDLFVHFKEVNKRFAWRYYEKVSGHTNDDLYSDTSFEMRDTIGNLFQPNTWYLFNFFNPHFYYYVYSDDSLNLKIWKEDLNPNL